ncbi:glycoside hydrolase family 3 C-terminal domain-containing protein [Kribbella sp. NBC_01245]|uniref:beta-glucosidase family protein n=1 Tax=Kribbella sp. NBC_01245 TaxID=2903578 RepID=UPI002E2B02B1|nr:glycoside hydrolase family 3 C-terminal domain-containing protein [Kribbella sp. NBC_01245]
MSFPSMARVGLVAVPVLVFATLAPPASGSTATPSTGRCGDHPWCDTTLSPDERAGRLLGLLTFDEKVSLLAGDDLFGVLGGEGTHTGTSDGVERVELPTTFYSDGPAGPRQGKATAMPSPLGLAATFSPLWAQRHGAVVGNEVKHKGNDVVFAPTVNIMRTPLAGRTFEGYGEDPYLSARTGVAWLRGAQSEGVIGNVKHFAANNQEGQLAVPPLTGLIGSRFTTNAVIDDRTLREIYLPAFEAAVKEAGVGSVMCSYNRVNGQWACENQRLLNEILKQEWGFKGFVLADYGATHSTANQLNNGLDFEPWPGLSYSPLAVKGALLTSQAGSAAVDEHVRRILRTLFAFGFFDRPAYADDETRIDKPGHARTAGEVAEQAITLLRNDGILPLDATKLGRIALIGEEAEQFKTGGGSSQIDPYSFTTPRKGIERRVGADKVTYDDGSDADRAASVAAAAEVAVVFASDKASEGSDKASLDIDSGQAGDQDALIEKVAAKQPNTIVVLETGGPVLTPWRSKVRGLLEAWYPGAEGGTALARVLFGDVDPGGRLPVTFPRGERDLPTTGGDPEAYPGVLENAVYKEGVLVGYRWYDARGVTPAYPFGYGLSYTSFAYSDLRIARGTPGSRVAASVSVKVTNTGKRTGTAVPQLYLGLPNPAVGVEQPPKQLKGFEKVTLAPGNSARVTFQLDERALSYWSTEAGDWRVAPGCYDVQVGSSSRHLPLQSTISGGHGTVDC